MSPNKDILPVIRQGILVTGVLLLVCGCEAESDPASTSSRPQIVDASPTTEQAPPENPRLTPSELRKRLGVSRGAEFDTLGGQVISVRLMASGVRDLSPLRGLPLRHLEIREERVADLTPLTGAPPEELTLVETDISDLSPLDNAPLKSVVLGRSPIESIAAVVSPRLESLVLAELPIDDLTPLRDSRLQALLVEKTHISNLAPPGGARSAEALSDRLTNRRSLAADGKSVSRTRPVWHKGDRSATTRQNASGHRLAAADLRRRFVTTRFNHDHQSRRAGDTGLGPVSPQRAAQS